MMLEVATPSAAKDGEDPDYIEANPPEPVDEPSKYFQTGKHEGMWLEYDERGVPTKSAKKKKPTKKEKDDLEQQYFDAKKKHGEYLNNVTDWHQRKKDAEARLEKTDRFRWCFRQVAAEKNAPIDESEFVELLTLLGYAGNVSATELGIVKKEVVKAANEDGKLDMDTLRNFVKETFPILLLEERLRINERCNSFEPTELYSPRTWRQKIGKDGAQERTDSKRSDSDAKQKSPRSRGSVQSPRGKKEKSSGDSPSAKADKKDKKEKKEKKEDAASPRASKVVKAKKEKK